MDVLTKIDAIEVGRIEIIDVDSLLELAKKIDTVDPIYRPAVACEITNVPL